MRVLSLVKELQAELMTGEHLPHLVSVRLLARLDEAERHLPMPTAPQPPKGELDGAELDGGFSTPLELTGGEEVK